MSGKAPVRRRAHDEEEDEHVSHERWLVTYADMVTLLMVLFIVMFAMSTVDATKFKALKDGLATGFGHSSSILSGSSPLLDDTGATTPGSAPIDQLVEDLPKSEQAQASSVLQKADQLRTSRQVEEAKRQVERLIRIWRKADAALRRKGLQDDVQATVDQRGLVISLVSRHVVFQPNVATLTPRGYEVVDTIAPVLARLPEPIELDGHTNQQKVHPKYYPTDWELSAARAVNVLRRLQEVDGLPARRLSATGFGHTRPLVDPSLPGSQEVNKRVDIVVLSQAPAQTRELFKKVYAQMERKS
ncbi:MAG: flagellar motor protein MotB [Nocardioidaceae bacterium]|nr:flagellar motor protein MotB [Nocardioidaceae bacterium]MCL2613784.1 flagellar motor protein MotB [Nocardioidaceae bacterium]